jgi:hypothetical protein
MIKMEARKMVLVTMRAKVTRGDKEDAMEAESVDRVSQLRVALTLVVPLCSESLSGMLMRRKGKTNLLEV